MEPYLLTYLGRAQAFVEVAVLPVCTSSTTTGDGLLNGLQHAIYHTLIQNVTKMAASARGRKDGSDLVIADKLERLVAVPPPTKAEEGSSQLKKKAVVPDAAHTQVPYLKQRCVSPNTKRARDEEDLSLTGVLRQEVFFSEFTRQWHAPLVGSNASPSATSKQGPKNGADPADVVRASDSAHTKWGTSPVFDALRSSLSPSDAQTLLKAYRSATHTTTAAAAVSMDGSQLTPPPTTSTSNVQDTAILALERYMVLDGLSTFLACGCKESPAFYKAHLDLIQTWDLSAALALNTRIACRCGVPETVIHAALHINDVPTTTTTGASTAAVPSPPSGGTAGNLAIIDDAVAMNRWRVEVVGKFLLELVFPLSPTSAQPSWLQLFIQRCMPEDVNDDDDDDDIPTVNSAVATPPGISSGEADGAAQDGGGEGGGLSGLVVSPGNVMTLMGTTPHLLPKVVVQQCRKNVFSEEAWSADHPLFSITAWELQHHYTMAELNKLHAYLKDASKGTWGTDPPPKVKAPMAALLFDSKEALRPYLVPQK